VFRFDYLTDAPIIRADDFAELGGNVNGPALIRCPDWIDPAPARYLLYFAHHEGRSIRLALADRLEGPWRLQRPAPLRLDNSGFAIEPPLFENLDPRAREFIENDQDGYYPHIASPDLWVDEERRQLRLYYHGRLDNGLQRTRVALSDNGLEFNALPEILALPYLRLFRKDDWFYALAMPAQLYRSRDGLRDFEPGPVLCEEPIRHHALLCLDAQWYLFWTRVGDTPERILVSQLHTETDWRHWSIGEGVEVHRAERPWEGADLPADASSYGGIMHRVNQLRDPAIYQQDGRIYLLYACAGEQGIGIGELTPLEG
jgi:hypothetical protein